MPPPVPGPPCFQWTGLRIPWGGRYGVSAGGGTGGCPSLSFHASGSFRSIFISFEREKQPAISWKIKRKGRLFSHFQWKQRGGRDGTGPPDSPWNQSAYQREDGITRIIPSMVSSRFRVNKGIPDLPATHPFSRETGGSSDCSVVNTTPSQKIFILRAHHESAPLRWRKIHGKATPPLSGTRPGPRRRGGTGHR